MLLLDFDLFFDTVTSFLFEKVSHIYKDIIKVHFEHSPVEWSDFSYNQLIINDFLLIYVAVKFQNVLKN